jgi:hypothetical protein
MSIRIGTMTLVVMALLLAPLARAGEEIVVIGEPVGPEMRGPSVVESMDAAIERDRARRAGPPDRRVPGEVEHGAWVIPPERAARHPHSGTRHAVNQHGDASMGIGFPRLVDVEGAWFARQMSAEVTARGVSAVGYAGGVEVARTAVLRDLDESPRFLAMGFRGVDRIVITAEPALDGAGWYALDDLTYVDLGAEAGPRRIVVDFEDAGFRQVLTGTAYAGLTWESGTGDFRRDEAVHPPLAGPPEDEEDEAHGGATEPMALGGGGTLPLRIFEFEGVLRGDAGSFSYPPDSNGAVGPDHFVITVNRNFAVHDKESGAELLNIHLQSFLPNSNGDPRVLWDHFAGRWIVLVSDFSATSSIYLAVSRTGDPLGAWFKTSFVAGAGSDAGCWPDYPTLGLDAVGIYTAANMVGCAGTIFAIDKAPLIADPPSLGTITAFRNIALDGAIQPCLTYGDSGGEIFVSRSSSTSLRVRRLQGPIAAPALVQVASVAIPSHAGPPDVPALGSTTPLDHSVSHRLLNAVHRNGSIWTVHDVDIGGRSAVRWYEIDADTFTVNQVGTVSDAVLHYFYGGIGVNAQGDVGLGFSGSSAAQYAGCYYTGRESSDPSGETAPPVPFKMGTGPQNNIDGFGRNRWGDYSLTTVDPDDDFTFWTIQEYGHDVDIWGTYVLEMRPDTPVLSFSYPGGRPELVAPAGDSVRVAIAGVFGGVLDPASPALHFDVGAGFVTAPMTLVAPGLYDAIFPALPCGTSVAWYVSADATTGETEFDPPSAPLATFNASAADAEIALADDFETDTGWSAENLGATSGDWQRGVPVNDPGWDYDPISDGDGSGRCFLTQNQIGNTDVDNGAVRLSSPPFDLTGVGVVVSYLYFLRLTNEDGADRLLVEASGTGAAGPWLAVAVHDTDGGLSWRSASLTGAQLEAAGVVLTSDVRFRFTANDADAQSIVEAGVDAFTVESLACDAIVGDADGDGLVSFADLLIVLAEWGPCPAPCPADVDGDGMVGFADLLLVLANWS